MAPHKENKTKLFEKTQGGGPYRTPFRSKTKMEPQSENKDGAP